MVEIHLNHVLCLHLVFFPTIPLDNLVEADTLPLLGDAGLRHLLVVAQLAVEHSQQARGQSS